MDDIGLDGQVVANEFGWVRAVGMDTTNLRGSKEYVVRTLGGEKILDGSLTGKIQFLVRAQNQIARTAGRQVTNDRTAHQTTMAGHIDSPLLQIHGLQSCAETA
jgi:hypothetical protein